MNSRLGVKSAKSFSRRTATVIWQLQPLNPANYPIRVRVRIGLAAMCGNSLPKPGKKRKFCISSQHFWGLGLQIHLHARRPPPDSSHPVASVCESGFHLPVSMSCGFLVQDKLLDYIKLICSPKPPWRGHRHRRTFQSPLWHCYYNATCCNRFLN